MSAHRIGIDLGTTGVRVVRVDGAGRVVAAANATYPLLVPQPGWTEQEPAAWWRATCEAARAVVAADATPIDAIGLSGQMHGCVVLDDRGEAIRPALLWNDQRTAASAARIDARVGRDRLRAITGNAALTGFQAPKLLWLRDAEPEAYRRVAAVLLPKDYLRFRLTGTLATDASDASGTLLLDLRARDWSPEILSALAIPRAWLPAVVESPTVTGNVTRAGAAETGFAAGTPVVAGAGDNAAAAIASGVVRPGMGVVSLGTSGVVLAHDAAARVDPTGALHAFCAAVPGAYHLMGVMLSAGGSLRWYRDLFAAARSYDALVAEAEAVAPGSDGLTFLPYLSGERTPHMDPAARGAFLGLTLAHGRAHLTRAVLEGVAYGLNDAVARMRALGVDPAAFVATGNGMSSALWRRIVSATFDRPLRRADADEGPAYGAALLAAVGAGAYETVEDAVAGTATPAAETAPPVPAEVAAYRAGYATFVRAYPALRSIAGEGASAEGLPMRHKY